AALNQLSGAVGGLPVGLTLSASGLLAGTPATPGTNSFTVLATDANGCTSTTNYSLTVNFPPAVVQVIGSTNPGGGTFVVPIVLAANGNENALSFSLNFTNSLLTYKSAALGSGAAGAVLSVNTNQAINGRLGVIVALAPSATFPAGM